MPTQKTNVGKGVVRPGEVKIPEGPTPQTAPSVAPSPQTQEEAMMEELYGRKMKKVDRQHLIDTYNADMDASAEGDDLRKVASSMLPGELLQAAVQSQQAGGGGGSSAGGGGRGDDGKGNKPPRQVVPPDDEMVRAIQLLTDSADQADRDGDPASAARMKAMAEQLLGGADVRRKAKDYTRHPLLTKLTDHFGLSKIKWDSVTWSGFKWTFAPISSPLRWWMAETIDSTTYRNAPPLHIACSLVALDGEPVWKIFNIPLTIEYEVLINEEDPVPTTFTVKPFRKFCECSAEVEIEDTECSVCGAILDPLDVPLKLRQRYAEVVYEWFMKDFGPLDRLMDLVTLRDAVVKDPITDEEEVYPLVSRSPVPTQMDSSPPGAE